MAKNIYGLDLGTYEIKVYDKKNSTIWKEKNVIAIADEKHIFSVGDEAYEMFEKAPENIQIIFPMKEGVISKFNDMQYLLQSLLKKDRKLMRGSEYVVAVPTDVTEVEKRAFYDLVANSSAKARDVHLVERGMADAISFGLDVEASKGLFIANFGGETTELSILSQGGIVLNKMLKTGGLVFDQAITNLVRQNYDLLIGTSTAEVLRKEFGVFQGRDSYLKVAGRNMISGVPQQKEISIGVVRTAIKEPLKECIYAMKLLIERTPPEVYGAIQKSGIYITGGLAALRGLEGYIEGATGLKVTVAKNPDVGTAMGLKQIILSKELKRLAYSKINQNYRWMK